MNISLKAKDIFISSLIVAFAIVFSSSSVIELVRYFINGETPSDPEHYALSFINVENLNIIAGVVPPSGVLLTFAGVLATLYVAVGLTSNKKLSQYDEELFKTLHTGVSYISLGLYLYSLICVFLYFFQRPSTPPLQIADIIVYIICSFIFMLMSRYPPVDKKALKERINEERSRKKEIEKFLSQVDLKNIKRTMLSEAIYFLSSKKYRMETLFNTGKSLHLWSFFICNPVGLITVIAAIKYAYDLKYFAISVIIIAMTPYYFHFQYLRDIYSGAFNKVTYDALKIKHRNKKEYLFLVLLISTSTHLPFFIALCLVLDETLIIEFPAYLLILIPALLSTLVGILVYLTYKSINKKYIDYLSDHERNTSIIVLAASNELKSIDKKIDSYKKDLKFIEPTI